MNTQIFPAKVFIIGLTSIFKEREEKCIALVVGVSLKGGAVGARTARGHSSKML
jgi:hypothetical protein